MSARHRFGGITGDEQTGGLVDAGNAVLLEAVTVVAMSPRKITPDGVIVRANALAVRLEGRINNTEDDRLEATFLVPAHDADLLVGMVLDGVLRAGGPKLLDDVLERVTRRIG